MSLTFVEFKVLLVFYAIMVIVPSIALYFWSKSYPIFFNHQIVKLKLKSIGGKSPTYYSTFTLKAPHPFHLEFEENMVVSFDPFEDEINLKKDVGIQKLIEEAPHSISTLELKNNEIVLVQGLNRDVYELLKEYPEARLKSATWLIDLAQIISGLKLKPKPQSLTLECDLLTDHLMKWFLPYTGFFAMLLFPFLKQFSPILADDIQKIIIGLTALSVLGIVAYMFNKRFLWLRIFSKILSLTCASFFISMVYGLAIIPSPL